MTDLMSRALGGRGVANPAWTIRPLGLSGRRRTLLFAAVYLLLLAACVLIAYRLMFSTFAVYDDEGFFDYSLKLFGQGKPLYSSVFSDYGPFYYELFGGLAKLAGHTITTDTGRLIQIGVWMYTTFALGIAAQRLTGRLAIGVTCVAVTFSLQFVLTNEPMHPAALSGALLATLVLIVAFVLPVHERTGLCALGVVAAAAVLTKINIGGFVVIAIVLAIVIASPRLAGIGPLRVGAAAVFLLVAPALMLKTISASDTQQYLFLFMFSAAALVITIWPHADAARSGEDPDRWRTWVTWLAGGFAALFVLCVVIAMALGSNLGDMWTDLVVVPSRQGDILSGRITLAANAIWWPLLAAAGAWTIRRALAGGISAPAASLTLILGAARALAGAAILLSLANAYPFRISPNAPFSLALPLAFVAAIPSRRDTGPRAALARAIIPLLAVLQTLQAYPVPGTQMYVGSLLLIPCGAVCLADGWSDIVAWAGSAEGRTAPIGSMLTALAAALACGLTFSQIIQVIQSSHDGYFATVPLKIGGASRLHVYEPLSGQLTQLTQAIHAAGCRSLVTYPGMYSLNMWTGLPAPSPQTGEQPFWKMLPAGRQDQVLAAAQRSPSLCEVTNSTNLGFYGGAPAHPNALISYLGTAFKPVGTIGAYELFVLKSPQG